MHLLQAGRIPLSLDRHKGQNYDHGKRERDHTFTLVHIPSTLRRNEATAAAIKPVYLTTSPQDCHERAIVGTGVICETWALQAAVIPAKAGIYSGNLRKPAVEGLDSRPSASSGQAFRGNDRRFHRDPIPNDTTTRLVGSYSEVSAALRRKESSTQLSSAC